MKMTNNTYDILKKIALVLTPLVTFVAALGEIWGLPYSTQIVATLAAVDTLLGAILHISSKNYNAVNDDADMIIVEREETEK